MQRLGVENALCHMLQPHHVLQPDEVDLFFGFDHGVGHPLLLLYDAKTPHGQKVKKFNGLGHAPSNISASLF
jgi:hypothetical protein